MEKIIEMCWDCNHCNNKKILARHTSCPNCGQPQDKSTKFYRDGDRIVDESKNKISRKPKWVCSYCNSLNWDESDNCSNCGASKSENEGDYFTAKNKEDKQNEFKSGSNIFSKCESLRDIDVHPIAHNSYHDWFVDYRQDTSSQLPKPKEPRKNTLIGTLKSALLPISIMCAIVAIIIGIFAFLAPKDINIIPDEKTWERSIEVEIYKTVEESDWIMPSGGRLKYISRDIYSYDPVIDYYKPVTKQVPDGTYISGYTTHYEDLGNGYIVQTKDPIYSTKYKTVTEMEPVYKSVPVYKDKYHYDIERWVFDRYEKTSDGNEPYWKELNLAYNEREGTRSEKYNIIIIDKKGKQKSYSTSFDIWKSLSIGNSIKVTISGNKITKINGVD